MPYKQVGDLEDLFRPEPVLELARRITERVAARLLQLVESYTPVASDSFGERDRPPGTLKRSWREGTLVFKGRTFTIEVYTDDKVAPHVEFPTRPHIIRPKPSRGPNARLRFRSAEGNVIYAREVHHPGTQGSYMMTRALATLEEEWPQIAREELDRQAALR